MEQATRPLFMADDEFFVLDSEHPEKIHTAFYGYAFSGSRIVENLKDLDGKNPDPDGAWVFILRENEHIRITQDFLGSYGLYLFRKDGYFALSNSFLKLVEYLSGKETLTLNREYTDYLLFVNLCSSAIGETPVKEIEWLDRGAELIIDIPSKTVDIRIRDYQENTVDPGTEEGIAILDAWWQRWTTRMLRCAREDGSVWVDLSGGFDTRMMLALALSSGMDMKSVFVFSKEDSFHTHSEDYRIASQIAGHYGFQLNNKGNLKAGVARFSPEELLAVSFYPMLGFHKQMYYKTGRHIHRWFEFSGKGGGLVRNLWDFSEEEYIEDALKAIGVFDGIPAEELEAIRNSAVNLLHRTFEKLRGKYRICGRPITGGKEGRFLYRESRGRHHFGKARVESHFAGTLPFAVMLDPELHRLRQITESCGDYNFLAALILDRYAPDLLSFPFDSGRSIAPDTIKAAREANRKYPFVLQLASPEEDTEPFPGEQPVSNGLPAYTKDTMDAVMFTAFCSAAFRQLFEQEYSTSVYDAILRDVARRDYHRLLTVHAAFSVGLVLWSGSSLREKNQSYIQFLLENADLSARGPIKVDLPEANPAERLVLLAGRLRRAWRKLLQEE